MRVTSTFSVPAPFRPPCRCGFVPRPSSLGRATRGCRYVADRNVNCMELYASAGDGSTTVRSLGLLHRVLLTAPLSEGSSCPSGFRILLWWMRLGKICDLQSQNTAQFLRVVRNDFRVERPSTVHFCGAAKRQRGCGPYLLPKSTRPCLQSLRSTMFPDSG